MTKQVELPEPEAMRGDYDGYGYRYIDNGSGSNWMNRNPNWEHLFTADQMRQYADDCVKEELRKIELEKKDGRE